MKTSKNWLILVILAIWSFEAAFAQDEGDLQDTSEEFNTKFNELLKEGNVTAA